MKRSKAKGGRTGKRNGKLQKARKVVTFIALVLLVCGLLVYFSGGSSVRWFGSETETVSEKVGDQVKEGSEKLGDKADDVQGDLKDKASQAKEEAKTTAQKLKGDIKKSTVSFKDYVKESAHKIKRSIADKLKGNESK
ncbi:MAG TPA: hypothetical protein VGK71_02725 [Nitrospirota bacterium]|jgi:ElaB/YqjD/DUF883 family membrane-anchored ribosome-binding protein